MRRCPVCRGFVVCLGPWDYTASESERGQFQRLVVHLHQGSICKGSNAELDVISEHK